MYPLFKKMGFRKNNCPNTDIFYKNMISFPFHIWMSNKEFLQMIKSIKKAVNILRKN
jgi:dTDP-4-amino-4,6-dideoxygalactose transaminase